MSRTTLTEVKRVIDSFFGDTSRSAEETLAGLEEIADSVEQSMGAIRSDLAQQEGSR